MTAPKRKKARANGEGCGSFRGKVVDQASSWWSRWLG